MDNTENLIQWEAISFQSWSDGRPVEANFFGSSDPEERKVELDAEESHVLAQLVMHILYRTAPVK